MEPFYLQGSSGRLFAIYHSADTASHVSPQGLVYVPPFAEEMNRARRMVALQARRLAARGIHVLLLDPFGTGDSAGDFGDADWAIWREDLKRGMAWLSTRIGCKAGLWGLRLGGLLAADVASEVPDRVARLVLWQPVLLGDRYLTQFLRLHIAAHMDKSSGRETTKDLRARLAAGETLEIAGYKLSPGLARAMSSQTLQRALEHLALVRITWLEIASEAGGALPTGSQSLVDDLSHRGFKVDAASVRGEPFWSIQEITVAPQLLRATDEALDR